MFYDWSDKLLPGIFTVAAHRVRRRSTRSAGAQSRGPAELGLEAAAMLAMAMPIALVGVMHATRWRGRILYGLAACLLLAGADLDVPQDGVPGAGLGHR